MRQTLLRFLLLFAVFSMSITTILAQRVVTGKVTSSEDGEPLPGVNVVVKGEKTGAITDIDGSYSIKTPQSATLIFSFIGFTAQEVPLGVSNAVNATLDPDTKQLGEVIVTAFGITRQKKALAMPRRT